MTALVVSDLHLGVPSGGDILRSDVLRARLLERAAAADRIVLLGDVVELAALGIRPWEIERLSEPELHQFMDVIAARRWSARG